MAIIDPTGLFSGERIANCSDEAQLHWVRLFTASNTFGRLELSYLNIIQLAYRSYKTKPTEAEHAIWIQENFYNFLLCVNDAEDGSTWGQWLTSSEYLSRYQTAADRRSPAPDEKSLEEYRRRYISSKQRKSLRINRVSEPHQTTPNNTQPQATISDHLDPSAGLSGLPSVGEETPKRNSFGINPLSEPHQTVPLGIGIGIGIGKVQEQKQNPCPAEKRGTGDLAPPLEESAAGHQAPLRIAAKKRTPPRLPKRESPPPTPVAPPIEWPAVPADPPVPPAPDPPKPPTKTALVKSRHAEFKAALWAYWPSQTPKAEMPWSEPEGRNLEMWLRSSPNTTVEQFAGYLANRCRSQDVNHAEPIATWILQVTRYSAGPLDRYGKPLNGGPNGRPAETNRAQQRTNGNLAALAAATAKLTGHAVINHPGRGEAGSVEPPDAGVLLLGTGPLRRP